MSVMNINLSVNSWVEDRLVQIINAVEQDLCEWMNTIL